MRSLLFVPGNKDNMLAKAAGLAPDVLVPDMEDSVPEAEKPSARQTIASWLPRLAGHRALLLPRINALGTPWFNDDIAAVAGPGVFGISVGKLRSARDVEAIGHALAFAEHRAGIEIGQLRLIPWIESAEAVMNCHSICTASERIGRRRFRRRGLCPRHADRAPRRRVECGLRALGDLQCRPRGRSARARYAVLPFPRPGGTQGELACRAAPRLQGPLRDPSRPDRDDQ
jgi:citrate lyase beta subunit